MDVQEAPATPATPTGEFRWMEDTGTFEIFDGNSALQNRKKRRLSLRRVSFAEEPSIHVFARDDDYETPPEGTMSHLSAQSTPTSVSRSPQRRSERLAAKGGRQDENEVDKENASVSVGSNARQSRRGRRPLALRDTQKEKKEKEEEFLKPSNWLDDQENSALGSCDDNSGPVDIRHITFDNQRVEVEDDDNMTMDSQTFHTRMSLMKQALPRLSETTWTGHYSDMESVHGQRTETLMVWHERQALGRQRQVNGEPTWHRGDGRSSDISEMSLDQDVSIFRVLAKERSSAKESSMPDSAENAVEGGDNWTEDDAESQGRTPSMEISESHTDGNDQTMEIDSGTSERLFVRNMQASTTLKESETTAREYTARQSIHQAVENSATLDNENIGFNPFVKSNASEDSPVPLKQYERKFRRTAAEKDISVAIKPKTDSKSQPSRSQGFVPEESLVRPQIGRHGQGLDRQESSLQHRVASKESRKSSGLQAPDGLISQGIEQETLLSAPDENTEPMDITRAWSERAPQHTAVPTKSSDSAKSFLWVDKDQSMDMSDVDMMEKYQEGITEAMPKLDFVLGGYNCDSPSAEPLNRILQRKSGMDGEDSPVYGVTAESDTKKAPSSRKGDDVPLSGSAEEKEIVSNRGLEEDTDELHFNIGKKRNGFQNPEDTFSFRGHQKCTRETTVSPSMEQNVMPKPTFSTVRQRVDIIEANLRNQSAPHNPGRDFQDEETTGELMGEPDWRAEVSSDMSTTPLSPSWPNHFHRLGTKSQAVPVLTEAGLVNSPSFQDGITAAIPNIQDLLAADARTPESELGWNPKKIDWIAQQSTRQALGDEEGLRQPGFDQLEGETMHSMPDRLCTPEARVEKNHIFECMTEEGARTLNQVSHSKEVRNSAANKMLLRMMSLQDEACVQGEASSDVESQQILRRTLQFQPESDSQLQSQSLRGDAEQQISAEDPDGTTEVESVKNVDEETNSTESRTESLRQESRRQKLLQDIQAAEERLVALEKRSEELRDRAQDCHKAIAKRCRNDSCLKTNESAAFCSQTHVSELKKRCQFLNCMQGYDLKTTKTGDNQVLHEFKYWSLLTHSIFERKENTIEASVSRSLINLNEECINQVYRHINASLAWRWSLLGDEVIQPLSLFYHVQGVNFKVMMLMDLMEEVNKCRKYLVIPHFRLQSGTGLHLGIQFSNSELLFDFVVLLDMRQVNHMRYSRRHGLDCATEMNQKLDCTVEMESAGRFFGKKITEAEIKSAVASVVPGPQLLFRICASINTLITRIKESVS